MVALSKLEIKIQSWNIHRAFFNIDGDCYCKLQHDLEFIRHIRGLLETHHIADNIALMQLPGYRCFNVCPKKLTNGPKSGGICVYVHESISTGVSKVNRPGPESILVKLKNNFFSFERDIIVSFIYCVPNGRSFQTRTLILATHAENSSVNSNKLDGVGPVDNRPSTD